MTVGDGLLRMIKQLFKTIRCCCGYSIMSNKWKYLH